MENSAHFNLDLLTELFPRIFGWKVRMTLPKAEKAHHGSKLKKVNKSLKNTPIGTKSYVHVDNNSNDDISEIQFWNLKGTRRKMSLKFLEIV